MLRSALVQQEVLEVHNVRDIGFDSFVSRVTDYFVGLLCIEFGSRTIVNLIVDYWGWPVGRTWPYRQRAHNLDPEMDAVNLLALK